MLLDRAVLADVCKMIVAILRRRSSASAQTHVAMQVEDAAVTAASGWWSTTKANFIMHPLNQNSPKNTANGRPPWDYQSMGDILRHSTSLVVAI